MAERTSHHFGPAAVTLMSPSLSLAVFSLMALELNLSAGRERSDVRGMLAAVVPLRPVWVSLGSRYVTLGRDVEMGDQGDTNNEQT